MHVRLSMGSGLMLCCQVLKFSVIFAEGPYFHFASFPTNCVADPTMIQWSWQLSLSEVGAQRNRERGLLLHPVFCSMNQEERGQDEGGL